MGVYEVWLAGEAYDLVNRYFKDNALGPCCPGNDL
jgi:hypothetical protein